MSKRSERARARASKLGDGAAKGKPALAPLHCPTCSAPVPLGTGDVATCAFCSAQVPLPETYRKLRDTDSADREDRAGAEALYQKLGSPSRTLDAWVAFTNLAGGVVLTVAIAILSISAALIFLAGFALEFFLHWIAPLVGIDLIDRFGGGTVYAAFAIGVVAFVLFPAWLSGYLTTSGEIRKTLQASLAARAPERPGFPSTCRSCGAALDVPSGALGVRCAYCQADNLVAIPASIVQATGARHEDFHHSIIAAAERAKALRAEARAGLPKSARNCAIFIVAFGLVGKGCTALDMDHRDMPAWSDTMTSPRQMSPYWDREHGVPIDTEFTPGLRMYIVALRRHEVLELVSRDDAKCASVSLHNMTSFPLVGRSWEMTWGAQTDGTYGAHWRAPYTGLYLVEIDGIDHGDVRNHVRWRIGTHSESGLPPAPSFKVESTAPPTVPPLPEAVQKLTSDVTVVPEGRPDIALAANDNVLHLWSLTAHKSLDQWKTSKPITALAVSRDGTQVVMITDRLELEAVRDNKIVPLGDVCELTPPITAAYVTPDVLAVAYEGGLVIVRSAKDGRALYALPKLGPVKSMVATSDGLVVVTPDGAHELSTPRWDPR